MTTTLRDVAQHVGVSVSTVSRALNPQRTRTVAQATQDRIMQAARELNYTPNKAAQRLAGGADEPVRSTHSVGLILGHVSYKFADPFWSPVLQGVDDELARQGYHLRFAFSEDDLARWQQRRLISRTHIDGLILVARVRPFTEAIPLERTVVIEDDEMRWKAPLQVDVIAIEKRRAMYALVNHLVALGRRRFAFFGPAVDRDERAEAFVQAVAQHNLPSDHTLFVESLYPAEDAYAMAKEVLSSHHKALDAAVCACDTIAIGVMRAAKEYGLRLPDDLAITGFDDIPFARDLDPPLTTVHVPKELLGALAVRKLIERLDFPGLPPIVQTVSTTLVVRASCGGQMRSGDVVPAT